MGTLPITDRTNKVRIIASASTWMEGEALRQLEETSNLPGMLSCVGMPDLHPGKGGPVGAAFLSGSVIRPHLVGSDIGCGMGLWLTDMRLRKAKPDVIAGKLSGLDVPWNIDIREQPETVALPISDHDSSLGTIGRGNHFAELQAVHSIANTEAAADAGIDTGRALLLVHSGSRSLGASIYQDLTANGTAQGMAADSAAAAGYIEAHDHAVQWAEINRRLIAKRFLEAIRADGERLLDDCHNSVTPYRQGDLQGWLHRKGASAAGNGLLVIAGSRGHLSALVKPLPTTSAALSSVAHGAGRKIMRSQAKAKLRGYLRKADLERNPYHGQVVCGDERLLWEEAPQAYKPISSVIEALEEAEMVKVVAWLRPIVTFKTSAVEANTTDRKKKNSERLREARRSKHGGHAR